MKGNVYMSKFETEYSNFPSKKITKRNFIDVTDNVAAIINQINALLSHVQYRQTAQILQANKKEFFHSILDAETFRT